MKYLAPAALVTAMAALLLAGCPEVHGSFDLEDQTKDQGARVVIRGKPVIIPAGKVAQGDVVVVEGKAQVDGHVKGSLVVIAGELKIGPTAKIEGELVAVGNTKNEVADGATVRGERVFVNWSGARWFVDTALFVVDNPVAVGVTTCIGFLVILVLAWLLIIRPFDTRRFHHTVANHPVRSGLLGLLIMTGLHVLMVLAFLSRYGIGLVPVFGLVLLALSVLGWIVVGGHVGRWLAHKYDWKVGPFWYGLAGVGIVSLALFVPLVGQLGWVLASWVGVGALLAPARLPESTSRTGPDAAPSHEMPHGSVEEADAQTPSPDSSA